jgi:AcrR family transcriptional regulator
MSKAEMQGAKILSVKVNQIDSIKKTAAELFAVKGYNNTSITDIVENANVARGTFYNHFAGKPELFEEIIRDVLKRLDESIRPIELGPGQAPILKQLRDNFSRLFSVVKEYPAVIHNYSNFSPGLENEFSKKFKAFDSELIKMVSTSLETGMALGLVRKCNARNAALLLIGGLKKFFIHHSLENNHGHNTNQLIDEIMDFYIKGLMY